MAMKNKTKKSNKKEKIEIYKSYDKLTNIEFKRNFKRDFFKILIVIFISLIFVIFNFNSKKVINIKSGKVKEIVLINYFTEESGKKMIISKDEDIRKICKKLNSIEKISKKEMIDSKLTEEKEQTSTYYKYKDVNVIIEVIYKNIKKENKIIKIKEDEINIGTKNYKIKDTNILNMWYTFNEKVENLTGEELEKYND